MIFVNPPCCATFGPGRCCSRQGRWARELVRLALDAGACQGHCFMLPRASVRRLPGSAVDSERLDVHSGARILLTSAF